MWRLFKLVMHRRLWFDGYASARVFSKLGRLIENGQYQHNNVGGRRRMLEFCLKFESKQIFFSH